MAAIFPFLWYLFAWLMTNTDLLVYGMFIILIINGFIPSRPSEVTPFEWMFIGKPFHMIDVSLPGSFAKVMFLFADRFMWIWHHGWMVPCF